MICRHCQKPVDHMFLDLGHAPLSNNYLSENELDYSEVIYPLRLFVCNWCWLVQTEDYAQADEIFKANYPYFSSISEIWLEHATRYSEMIIGRLALDSTSFVIEIASNDGYLLKNFLSAGIPCLGIEPTDSTADAAEKLGVPILRKFFDKSLGLHLTGTYRQADLVIGNNVYAHVPDINDFTSGLKAILKPQGTITLEFPHLLYMITLNQFDTVYHEHRSYLSLRTVMRIFATHGLKVYDVDQLSTHGGSLRVYGCHAGDRKKVTDKVYAVLAAEMDAVLEKRSAYNTFQGKADAATNNLVSFLLEQKDYGKSVAGYGAAAKGCTLLNYGGIKADLLPFVCDAAPSKQGKFLPGCRIPILPPVALQDVKPDYVIIFPWNIAAEIIQQLGQIRKWGGKFVKAMPNLEIL